MLFPSAAAPTPGGVRSRACERFVTLLKILVSLCVMLRSAIFVLVVLVAFERPAAAYLDPGTGSMLLQALLGGVAAVAVIARLYWHRLSAVFRGKPQGSKR